MTPKLRAVKEDETAPKPPPKPKTVTDAAKSGTARDLLVATQDRIAVESPNTPARDFAALTKRLMETVKEIEAIDARHNDDPPPDAGAVRDGAFDASAV